MNLLNGKKGSQIFNEPYFELKDSGKWNKEIALYFKEFNSLKDERASVIFFAIAIESELDKLNSQVFKKYKLFDEDPYFTFSLKIKVLKALIKNIRNKFAHNIDIHNIKDLENSKSGKDLISKLDSYCNQLEDKLLYSKLRPSYISKFKDIAALSIKALRYYQPNIKLLRDAIEEPNFENRLKEKAQNLKKEKDEYFEENFRNFFKKSSKE
jgi:hypothetical protein